MPGRGHARYSGAPGAVRHYRHRAPGTMRPSTDFGRPDGHLATRRAGQPDDPGRPKGWAAAVRQPATRLQPPTGARRREGAAHALLDDVAKQIIEQLQEDGRRPYASIGKAVGLSEAAVRQRVQRLLDAGVMQIVAVTDPLQLGFPRQAMIGVRTPGDLEEIADRLAELDEVDYVVITAGSFDLLTEVVCRNDDHLLEILQRLRARPRGRGHRGVRLSQAARSRPTPGGRPKYGIRCFDTS